MKTLVLFIAIVGAITNSLVMVITWWWAAFNGWEATVILSRYNEHWLEGIMFHAFFLATIWGMWRYWRRPVVIAKDLKLHG